MTISADSRRSNLSAALVSFLASLGDNRLDNPCIAPNDHSAVLPTTWRDLVDKHLLAKLNGVDVYKLTPHGYREALKASGQWDEEELKVKLGRLCKVLKRRVKGRNADELVSFHQLPKEAEVSDSFVYNAIDCGLIESLLKRKGVQWDGRSSMKGQVVTVPVTFGQELI